MIEIVGIASFTFVPLFMLWELVRPHRRFDAVRWWRLRGLVGTVTAIALSFGVAFFWADVVGERTLFDLSGLGTLGGFAIGVLVYELVHYWYHRLAHRFDPLWRWAHQMHHSAESVDAFGAYWLHPVDTFFFTTWSSLILFPLLGVSLEAGVLANAFLMFNAAFQHANLATPRWLGYIVQRPESHGVHHERGVHAYNYSDLPLWDLVFGTFRNPRTWHAEAGFYRGASTRVGEMLIGRDVSEPPVGRPVLSSPATGDAWSSRA